MDSRVILTIGNTTFLLPEGQDLKEVTKMIFGAVVIEKNYTGKKAWRVVDRRPGVEVSIVPANAIATAEENAEKEAE